MNKFIGTKLIQSEPMNRLDYNKYRGWELPEDENGDDEGYLVEYLDGGESNHPNHEGYISWSPKEQFDNAYRPTDGMSFGLAVEAMKQGYNVSRTGWNPSESNNVYLFLFDPYKNKHFDINEKPTMDGTPKPYIALHTGENALIPADISQVSMLSDDWIIVE